MSICVRTMISYVIQLCLYIISTKAVTLHVEVTLVNVLCHVSTQALGYLWTTFACVYIIFVIDLPQVTVNDSKGESVSCESQSKATHIILWYPIIWQYV